jgi:hydroxymethylglutaryl-CoA lyase
MIRIIEVGPRDGLQNEPDSIATAVKVAFVDALSRSGVDEVEVTAFVSPQWVPQLADASAVLAAIVRQPGVVYSALVPNEQGMDRADASALDKVCIFTAASDSFNRKNVNTDIAGTFVRMAPVVKRAKARGLLVRGYVSTAFWCPYEGHVHPDRVLAVAERLLDLGADEISIGDTIGKATPSEVTDLLTVLLQHLPAQKLALHFHDTYGRATANVAAAHAMGINLFDASVGGLGGCPYAPGAAGNVATEVLVAALQQLGADVRVDLQALGAAKKLMAPYSARLRA